MMTDNTLSHMPFLLYDNVGHRVLLFAKADDCKNRCWKLFYQIDEGRPQRLETGFSHGRIECSPTAWQDDSGWHVSFVAMDDTGVYRLYRMDGMSLDSLSAPVSLRLARTGFVYKDRLCVGEIQDLVHVHDSEGDHRIELPGTFIYRVSYRADEPQKLLISGDWIGENEEPFTVEYNLADDTQRFIECDGRGAYTGSIESLLLQVPPMGLERMEIDCPRTLEGRGGRWHSFRVESVDQFGNESENEVVAHFAADLPPIPDLSISRNVDTGLLTFRVL